MIADDPIFALIERHKGATRAFSAAVSQKNKVQAAHWPWSDAPERIAADAQYDAASDARQELERGSNVSSTSPSHNPYICPIFSTVASHSGQWHGGSFSPWIYGQGKGRKRVERKLYFTQPPSIYLSYILPC